MIQRIQSVYLLMAGLVLAFSFCTPQINFSGADGVVATMYALALRVFPLHSALSVQIFQPLGEWLASWVLPV